MLALFHIAEEAGWSPNLDCRAARPQNRVNWNLRQEAAMEQNLDQDRRQAHALLDALPAEKLNAVRSLLEVMVEPLARSLALAQVEEEGLTPETTAALERARVSLARGEGIPHDQILREFGLKQ